ncbi:MAG: signal peptidase I [Clostridia bacterium]|nr:signal peptidase I [Clostridia bacterium]
MQTESERDMAETNGQSSAENDNAVEAHSAGKKKSVKREILSWVLTLGAAVLIALVIRTILFEPIRVDGSSMNHTLVDGEIMLVTKPEYIFSQPSHGDVVICRYPGRTEYFVKRLMGLPGDVIEVIDNVVFRNEEELAEPYLSPENNRNGFSMPPFTLGDDEYFVMGDNRDHSHDSRNYYGTGSPAALTRGQMTPVQRIGNRFANAFSEIFKVPDVLMRDQIIGHVQFVLFPFDKIRRIQ